MIDRSDDIGDVLGGPPVPPGRVPKDTYTASDIMDAISPHRIARIFTRILKRERGLAKSSKEDQS